MRRCEDLAARCDRDLPLGEQDRADRQRDAGKPVQDRQGRADLYQLGNMNGDSGRSMACLSLRVTI